MAELTFFTLLYAAPVFAAWTLIDVYRMDPEVFRTRILRLPESSRPAPANTGPLIIRTVSPPARRRIEGPVR